MDVDLEELAAIIELLDKTEFTQFRFEKGDLRIAVSRGVPLDSAAAPRAPGAVTTAPPAGARVPEPTRAEAELAPAEASDLELNDHEVIVRSPMLGTFYRSPKPGDAPFVEPGTAVEADSVLCIIEVMKLMNSVAAGSAGEVRRVLVSDGDLVEFDQPLFVIGRSP